MAKAKLKSELFTLVGEQAIKLDSLYDALGLKHVGRNPYDARALIVELMDNALVASLDEPVKETDEYKELTKLMEAMQVRLDKASKAVCLRMQALRRRIINGAWWYIEDDELAAMRDMFNEPWFVEMELECNRCKGTGQYMSYGKCWKCTHGRMLQRNEGRGGVMTIIDQAGENGRHTYNGAKEERRQAIEGQTPTKAPAEELDGLEV